jgi:hypothetical protein
MSRKSTSPNIKKHLLPGPDYINKVPILYRKIKGYRLSRSSGWLQCVTHCQINSSNSYVETNAKSESLLCWCTDQLALVVTMYYMPGSLTHPATEKKFSLQNYPCGGIHAGLPCSYFEPGLNLVHRCGWRTLGQA